MKAIRHLRLTSAIPALALACGFAALRCEPANAGIVVNWVQVATGTVQAIYSGTMPVAASAPYGAPITSNNVNATLLTSNLGAGGTFSVAVSASPFWSGTTSPVSIGDQSPNTSVVVSGDKFGYFYDAGTPSNNALFGPLGWTLGQAISGTMTFSRPNLTLAIIGASGFSSESPLVLLQDQDAVPLVSYVPEPSTWVMAGVGIAYAGWRAVRRRKWA